MIEIIAQKQNGVWRRTSIRSSSFTEATVPRLRQWIKRDHETVASYFCYRGEKPYPPLPAADAVLDEVKLTPAQLEEVKKANKGCGCNAAKKQQSTANANSYVKRPSDTCIACAEKHLGTAYALYAKESGYRELNRWHYIGELNSAQQHIYGVSPEFAEKIRLLRHDIQYDVEIPDERWQKLAVAFEKLKLNAKLAAPVPGKIFVFSNVPSEGKIDVSENDLLVFINKAIHADKYAGHPNRIVFHRSDQPDYGSVQCSMANLYVFGKRSNIPSDFIERLKKSYDWSYEIEEGKVKSCTTGYMVVKYLEYLHPDNEIVLVNFGYEVSRSTYRCPWHNWLFEDRELQTFKHVIIG